MEKTIVREAAFRALFQFNFIDLKEVERESYMDDSLKNALDGEEFPEVLKLKDRHIAKTKILFEGTLANLEKIDEIIKAYLKEDWSFSRLATAGIFKRRQNQALSFGRSECIGDNLSGQ